MTNKELTLDQLQAISGGAIRAFLINEAPKDQVSIECKVPAPDKKPQDGYTEVEWTY